MWPGGSQHKEMEVHKGMETFAKVLLTGSQPVPVHT